MSTENGNAAAASAGGSGDVEKTSKDYYFDSYAHFGIHEVCGGKVQIRVDV